MSESTCRECGATIRYPTPQGKSAVWLRLLAPSVCESCTPIAEARIAAEEIKRERQEAAARRQERAVKWLSLCPPRYADTNPELIAEEYLAAVTSWQFGQCGLGLTGTTGLRKTRAIFVLLKRIYVEEGRRFGYITMPEFSHKVSRLSGERMEQLDDFIADLCRVPVLFLDDLGKGRLTDRVESEFYHVIEERYKNMRPILFTANGTAAQLAGMMGDDRGVAVMRRLADACEVIRL